MLVLCLHRYTYVGITFVHGNFRILSIIIEPKKTEFYTVNFSVYFVIMGKHGFGRSSIFT